jgi:hypothetical protein
MRVQCKIDLTPDESGAWTFRIPALQLVGKASSQRKAIRQAKRSVRFTLKGLDWDNARPLEVTAVLSANQTLEKG